MAYLTLYQKPQVFIDTETSGLDPVMHELLDFAAIKDGVEMSFKIKPRRIFTASPKALEVNGYNAAEWEGALEIHEAAPKIAAFLKDSVIVGHNVRFDMSFIAEFLKEAQMDVRLDYHLVDTVTLAYVLLVPKGLISLSLEPVCNFLRLPPEPKQHRALAGARACKAVYEKMTSQLPW